MKKDSAFLRMLRRPHGVFLVLVYFFTLVFAALAILLMLLSSQNDSLNVLAYVAYALAALTLFYSCYTLVIYARTMKTTVKNILKKNKFTEKLVYNYGFKTLLFSSWSFLVNVAFAVTNLVGAIRYRLVWYAAISAYYFTLILFRGGILYLNARVAKTCKNTPEEYLRRKWRIHLFGGIVLALTALAMSVAVTEMMLSRRPLAKGEIMTIATAAFTFYKISMSIYNVLKARRLGDPVLRALRSINFSDACMSLVSLTVLMLSTFGEGISLLPLKAAVGFSACGVIVALSVKMIVTASKNLRSTQNQRKIP